MSEEQGTKKCSDCKLDKPIAEFGRRRRGNRRNVPRSECKACGYKQDAARRAANPEKVKFQSAAYYAANAEKLKRKAAAYCAANPEKIKRRKTAYRAANAEKLKREEAAYRAANPEKIKRRNAASYAANAEERKRQSAAWRAANPDKVKRRTAAYCAANPDKVKRASEAYRVANTAKIKRDNAARRAVNLEEFKRREAAYRATPEGRAAVRRGQQKRRARKAGATIGDTLAITAWEATWRKSLAVQCHWCGLFFPGSGCQADHRIPLAKKGPHHVDNHVVACKPCNKKKADMLPEDFNATLEQPWLFF